MDITFPSFVLRQSAFSPLQTITTMPQVLKPMLKNTAKQPPCEVVSNITSLMKALPQFFNTIGNIPGHYTIRTNPNVKPIQHANNKVPKSVKEIK